MLRHYRWTTGHGEVAADAVTVRIGSDYHILEAAGLSRQPPTASVCWPERMFQAGRFHARSEGPFDPAVALDHAAVIAERYGFSRVVVSLQHRSLWNDAWGKLASQPGLD